MQIFTNQGAETDVPTGSMAITEWTSGHIGIELHQLSDDAVMAVIDTLQQHLSQGDPQVH